MWHAVPWVKRGILLGFRVRHSSTSSRRRQRCRSSTRTRIPIAASSSTRERAHRARRFVDPPRRVSRARRRVHAADVRQCRRVCRQWHDDRLARARRIVRADRQARAPERGGADRRRARAGERGAGVIEDDVLVGGNCGVYEGTIVRARAVLAAGVVLTRGTPVYDLVQRARLSRQRRRSRWRFPKAPSSCRARARNERLGRRAAALAAGADDREVPRRKNRPRDRARGLAAMSGALGIVRGVSGRQVDLASRADPWRAGRGRVASHPDPAFGRRPLDRRSAPRAWCGPPACGPTSSCEGWAPWSARAGAPLDAATAARRPA